jgi:hypothetical protein
MIKKFSLCQNTYDLRTKLNPNCKFYLVKILHGVNAAFSSADTVVRKEIKVIPESESYELVSGENIIDSPIRTIRNKLHGEFVSQLSIEKNGLIYLWCDGDTSALFGFPCDAEIYKEPCYEALLMKYSGDGWEVFDIAEVNSNDDEDYYASYFFYDEKSKLVPSDG